MPPDYLTENTASPAMLEAINPLLTSSNDKITKLTPISGGSICQAFRAETKTGQVLFVKILEGADKHFFVREAEGLKALFQSNSIKTPSVLAVAPTVLVMNHIEEATPSKKFWRRAGEQLAQLHKPSKTYFGFDYDNFCGRTTQPNPATDNGFDFFSQSRLLHQVALADKKNLLTLADKQKIDRLCHKLPNFLPDEPPSLLHGDLWSGNLICDLESQPWLIDPAVYYGWREIDIAMTTLFGGFQSDFYEAYQYHHPLEPGWQERMDIYNLYPLLNHLNLFGPHYLEPIRSTLNRFV